ncbi:telomere-associated protein RIF1 [Sabethes cyaneus]|uniref:telomere-associated protein RIF1 n=1 Tax=Sabethes cyaneus TaxID=53552 RepID=UPI00237E4B31|nr:telomere-associated protein RIF1 [Sabethes cyaneus]
MPATTTKASQRNSDVVLRARRYPTMTAAAGIKLPGQEQYDKLRKALQSGNRSQIDKILESLVRSCQKRIDSGPGAEKPKIDEDQLNFWLNDVLRLLFDWENPLTRDLALRALEAVLPHLEQTLYLDSTAWPSLKTQISNVYSNLLDQARGRNDPEWHRKWSVLVRILDREICQGAVIINVFLAIVESGFRSSELLVREQSFDCWKLLVEIFAKYNQISIPKRIKLICIPLKSSKSKTEVIAKKKFEIWWFLINKLRNQLDAFADNVFEPFIYFCFGPSFKTPLCYYFDNSYQEFGAPGKIYNSIKQLSAVALIQMLGPATKATEALLQEAIADNNGKNGLAVFNPVAASETNAIISPKLFTVKAKLLINSCTECTVLFSQMKQLNYLELNQCLWKNLLAMVEQEKTIPRSEMLDWIRENLAALINLSTQSKDESIRQLTHDTIRMVAETKLLTVTIGQDSPEQLANNYRTFMSLLFNSDLDYPEDISQAILSAVFDLRRYSSSQASGYWDMLQKTVQYLSDLDAALFHDSTANRRFIAQIYRLMAVHLKEQIIAQRRQFERSSGIALGFLLYPLEYDRCLQVDAVSDEWQQVYAAIVSKSGTRYACAFSELVKAMTVAKYNCNLGVILNFFCVVLEAVPGDFDPTQPPVKTLELFKDLVRKALVFQNSLKEVSRAVECFARLIERMSVRGLLVVIMPIRNVISEMVTGDNSQLVGEVKVTLKTLVDRFVAARFATELKTQPKEVKWNCKMLVSQLLELPSAMQRQWKVGDLKKLMDICEGKEPTGKPAKAAAKKEGEFVVIDKVWKFTPDKLTEHQRDRMREKRDDIPALYNDMSQSQDSFVIKPWTPNKIVIPADANNDHDTIVMCASGGESNSVTQASGAQEASVPKEQGAATGEKIKLDKENNNGNVPSDAANDKEASESSSTSAAAKKAADKKTRVARELDQLKIDTIEGKNLQVGRLARTRRSGSLEPAGPPTRKKLIDLKKSDGSRKSAEGEKKRVKRKVEKIDEKPEEKLEPSSPAKKTTAEEKPKISAERTSPRKSLNFDNVVDKEPTAATEAPSTRSPAKVKNVNESVDEIIESSQQVNSQSVLARKFTTRKPKEEEKEVTAAPALNETLPFDTEAEIELAKLNRKSPNKVKSEDIMESPSKNTRSAVAAAQQKPSDTESVLNTLSPATLTEPETASEPLITQIEKPKPVSPAKSPKKGKRSLSPAPEPMETDQSALESPNKTGTTNANKSPNVTPTKSLDDQLEPLVKNLNRSLVSSPEGADQEERDADLLNSTLNISPIAEAKAEPSTPLTTAAAACKDPSSTGSGEKRLSSRLMEREKTSGVMPSPVTRRTRNSPPVPAAMANLKARTLQMTPRSPSTHRIELRGRGAQLINLIRNQQNESSPKPSGPLVPQHSSTPKPTLPSTPVNDRCLMMRKMATSSSNTPAGSTTQSPDQPKPLEKEKEKDYLVFSKVLPSPQASPAASILKRKLNHEDSGDDMESPANKRKRVSFHDPPVSLTKEYIRQEEECRSPSINRCLQLVGMSPADKAKFLLRRKTKTDSLSELVSFTQTGNPPEDTANKEDEDEITSSPESLEGEFMLNTTDNMSTLQVTTDGEQILRSNASPNPSGNPANTVQPVPSPPVEAASVTIEQPLKRTSPRKISPKVTPDEPVAVLNNKKPASPIPAQTVPEKPDTSIRFQSEDEILAHVISTHSLDSVLERYLAAGKSLEQNKSTRLLTRELSTLMSKDAKTRYTVLDELSERHSAEFLDHAVQENSSAMVCQRLSMITMIEFIFEQLKKLPPPGGDDQEAQNERTRILQTMFDNLLQLDAPAEVVQLRENFVKAVIRGKSRAELMDLLEEYFTNRGIAAAKSI